MKRQISFFFAAVIIAMAAMFAFASTKTTVKTDSCRTQCRVAYDKCVKETSNPGGLNQCRKAYQGCLSGCS